MSPFGYTNCGVPSGLFGSTPTTINIALSANYAAQWGPVSAFREFVQNWRDGIIKSFNLSENDFHVISRKNSTEIIYKVKGKKGTPKWLGYIRWYQRNGVGIVDITNRQATLEPQHLDMGDSSKSNDQNQAGTHGEGLKVALLVMMRGSQNHAVECYSGGHAWAFDFDMQRKLVAYRSKMTSAAIDSACNIANNNVLNSKLLPFGVHPGKDVQFLIGTNITGRTDKGLTTLRKGVTRNEFKEWTRAALFLQDTNSKEVVRTSEGDLIMDPRFSGNVYLKGLLLKESTPARSASITGKTLRYGYNFATGVTNRERESVADADDETRAILSIWNHAIRNDRALVESLHELLDTREPEYADVERAQDLIQGETENFLKDYLLGFGDRWYYTSMEKDDVSAISLSGKRRNKLTRCRIRGSTTSFKVLDASLLN